MVVVKKIIGERITKPRKNKKRGGQQNLIKYSPPKNKKRGNRGVKKPKLKRGEEVGVLYNNQKQFCTCTVLRVSKNGTVKIELYGNRMSVPIKDIVRFK